MQTRVISLDRDVERRERFLAQWTKKIHLLPPVHVVSAIDPSDRDLPPEWSHRFMGYPAWGCALTHHDLWQQVSGMTLVFEDDAVFSADFEERLAATMQILPADWDLLYLGGEHEAAPEPVSAGLVRPTKCHRSHAYVLRDGDSAMRLYQFVKSMTVHVDRAMIHAYTIGPIKAYAASPWLVGQGAGYSSIMSRDEPERWWRQNS